MNGQTKKYTVGVDLGGTNIAIGVVDGDYRIVLKDSVPTKAQREADAIVEDMAKLAGSLLERLHLTVDDVEYVGIAAPGSIDIASGSVVYTNNLPFINYPMADKFRAVLPVEKIYLENDANAAALGEAVAGAAKGAQTAVMITLGTGVGSGIILGGKVFGGGINHAGAELGHTVIHTGGLPCSCGRRGCWEAYSSATALSRMTREHMDLLKAKGIPSLMFDEAQKDGKISARTAFAAMKRGDAEAKKVVDEYIYNLATGVANVVNIFQPEAIIIGGGVCNEKENLTKPLTEFVEREQYTCRNKEKTKIVTAILGNDAGIIGAAALGK